LITRPLPRGRTFTSVTKIIAIAADWWISRKSCCVPNFGWNSRRSRPLLPDPQYLLIDEFQDTNTIQYAFIRVLAGDTGQVFVVGDDDQAIYGWRGAKVEKCTASCGISCRRDHQLEQNYRSTEPFLPLQTG
jgi:hypothetical protein